MSDRKSFILHKDSLSVLDDLSDEQAGRLFKAIMAHQCGIDIEIDAITRIALSPFKSQFDRDDEKYEKKVNANKINGMKGGRPKSEANPEKAKEPSGLFENPENPQKGDSGSGSGSENKKDSSPSLDFSSWPSLPSDQLIGEWKQLRKRLKAGVTQTVINRTGKELHIAVKAGFTVDQCFEQWVYKGWRGFEASWMMSQKPDLKPQQQSKQPRAFGS